MKQRLRVDFSDFWAGFSKEDNYFYHLLCLRYEVEINDEPDVVFYSCYGTNYLRYHCIRVFYTAENLRPDYSGCDYAMTFDHTERKNHHRLPLYALYINHRYSATSHSPGLEELMKIPSPDEIRERWERWERKQKFCSMVVSNGKSKKRLEFFKTLSRTRHVDSGGAIFNNIGGPVKDKLPFIEDYQFVISFENASHPGYVTEKLLEPLLMGCIPIYWGDPVVHKDFNTKRLLNFDDYGSAKNLIRRMLEIESNQEEALKILSEPIFPGNKIPEQILDKNVLSFLERIVEHKEKVVPVATSFYKRKLHALRRLIGLNSL